MKHVLLAAAVGLSLTGCALKEPSASASGDRDKSQFSAESLSSLTQELLLTPSAGKMPWEPLSLPGKRLAEFEPLLWQGAKVLRIRADSSVSILRQRLVPQVHPASRLRFTWRVDGLPKGASLSRPEHADSPVRVVLAFAGDRGLWSPRTHRLSEMSRLVTGEELPYATLAYVWSEHDDVGTVLPNARTDRIRKMVVERGNQRLGQWLTYERDVRADFLKAFGEEPGPIEAIALMTDTDNTKSRLQAWYGGLQLNGQTLP